MTATVVVERQGHIGVVRLNRPERRNALDHDTGRALVRGLRELDADPEIRAVVVTGEGPGFCAGADLAALAAGPDALSTFAQDPDLREMPVVPTLMATPVATAVRGGAAGAGFVLALAGDACFVDSTAKFIPVFPRLGLVAEYGVAWLLPRRIGAVRAADVLITGRTINADEAVAWGLANAKSDDPLASALDWAAEVCRSSPTSTRIAKAQLLAAGSQSFHEALEESLALMQTSFHGPDLPEALQARLDGREPRFGSG